MRAEQGFVAGAVSRLVLKQRGFERVGPLGVVVGGIQVLDYR